MDNRYSLIGQGTWMLEKDPEPRAIEALRLGIDLGMTLIDTAEMYGSGRAESLVGKALAGRRHEVFLVSKVLPSNASYDGTRRACERTLQRLGTDKLDLYLLHWPGSHPIRETMRGLESLVSDGVVDAIGVSNFDVDQLEEAQAASRNHALQYDQVLYHLGDRGIERRLIPFCRRHGITVMGYSPFGHGEFRGSRELSEIATDLGKTPRQVVLNFLTRDGVAAIPKSGNPEHVRENAGALGWRLPESAIQKIDKLFPAPDKDTPLGMI